MLISTISDIWNGLPFEYRLYYIVIALFIPVTIGGIIAQISVDTTFTKCDVSARCGLTAAEVARRVLDANGLTNVKIVRISGRLTDNFNPKTNVLSLSDAVYGKSTVSAIGVACHEAGHAIQHSKKYVFSSLRLALVPVVNFTSRLLFPIMLIGMLFGFFSAYGVVGQVFVWAGVVMFGMSLLFSLVTLPTEFDASRRAQEALRDGYLTSEEAVMSRKVLTAAAMTYVVSFLMSLLQFLRFLAILLMRTNRRR